MKAPANQSAIDKFSQQAGDWIHSFFYVVEDGKTTGSRYEILNLGIVCALTVLVLGSACWAAAIASARRRNPFIHFLGGLIIPVIYPLFILLTLDVPRKLTEDKKAKEMEQKVKEAEQKAEEKESQLPRDENGNLLFQPIPAYFEKIIKTEDGTPGGPWNVDFNGTAIVVTQIIEVLPECVNVEFYDVSPDKTRTMRIPYGKINTWVPVA